MWDRGILRLIPWEHGLRVVWDIWEILTGLLTYDSVCPSWNDPVWFETFEKFWLGFWLMTVFVHPEMTLHGLRHIRNSDWDFDLWWCLSVPKWLCVVWEIWGILTGLLTYDGACASRNDSVWFEKYEEFWLGFWLMTVLVHPEMTLCGLRNMRKSDWAFDLWWCLSTLK